MENSEATIMSVHFLFRTCPRNVKLRLIAHLLIVGY